MLIRPYTPGDLAALRALHFAQNLPYAFPDLSNPLFLTKLVVESDSEQNEDESRESQAVARIWDARGPSGCDVLQPHGHGKKVIAAALLRLTAEAYLLLDPHAGTPRERWTALLALHEAARADARARGLDDAHAWLPPQVARAFGRRLERLGWFREPWPSFSRATR